jgi:predicted enzyme related to lactoylglutathione lyase
MVINQNGGLSGVGNYAGGLVTIATIDFERAWKFYADLLSQEPQPFMPNVYAEFSLPGICLGIFRPQESSSFSPGAGAMSLCLEVTDLELAVEHAIQAGCLPPTTVITASHGREAYVYDPDGNRIILHQGKSVSTS